MLPAMWRSSAKVAQLLRDCLEQGRSVEIDGLGTFLRDPKSGFRFHAAHSPRVFLAYGVEDAAAVARLYGCLAEAGFAPWMDRRKLLPGQNWPRAIQDAIETSDFFVACFSNRSVGKRGQFQAEIRYALDCARRVPLDEIFFVPVRLDDCRVPLRVRRELHYVDLFPDWDRGLRRIVSVMRRQAGRQRAA